MSVLLRSSSGAAASPAPAMPASPPAARGRRPGWRDPRLAVGLLLVVGSVLLGARVLAAADDTVLVLAATRPLAAGQPVDAGDLGPVRLRFADSRDAQRYLPAGGGLPPGAVLSRAVGAGELVPRAAVEVGDAVRLVDVPLAVDPALVPSGLGRGAVVDVWVAPAQGAGAPAGAGDRSGGGEPLLRAVPVLSTSRGATAGTGGRRQVVVGVPADAEQQVARVVAQLGADSALLLVRRPG